ncbi:hypothetical protein NMY22_g10233 [Coprinellus aureogranulatus]|nr:hypothetical protein NMY22_g10233 [Coprinellus aureogranulatus]
MECEERLQEYSGIRVEDTGTGFTSELCPTLGSGQALECAATRQLHLLEYRHDHSLKKIEESRLGSLRKGLLCQHGEGVHFILPFESPEDQQLQQAETTSTMPATDGSEAGVAARDAVLSTSDSVSQAQKEEKGVTITPVRVRLRAKPATIAQCPPEVLHKIFQLTLVVDVFDHEAELLRTNIRLVSSQWNQVMLSDPAFWTSIFVTFLKAGKPFMLHPFKRNYRNPSYEEGGIRTTAEEAGCRLWYGVGRT